MAAVLCYIQNAPAQTLTQRLPNGIALALTASRNTELIGISLLVHGGTLYEAEGEMGTYALIPGMLKRGTLNQTAYEIMQKISLIGDSVDMYVAAECWSIEATVPPQNLRDLLSLVKDLLFNPLFPEEGLEKEKNIAIQSIKSGQDSPLSRLFKLYHSVFYPDFYTPESERIEHIKNIGRDKLRSIHQRFFQPDNIVISLAGNFQADEALKQLEEHFGSIPPPQASFKRIVIEQPGDALPGYRETRGGLTQAGVLIGTRLEGFERSKEPVIEVLNAVLVNSIGGRLFEEVREKRGFVYHIDAYYSLRVRPFTWFIFATTRKRHVKKVIEETKGVLQGLIDNPPGGDELRLAREYVKTELAISYQSPSAQAAHAAYQIMRDEKIKGYNERLEEIELVSEDDLRAFVQKHFTGNWTVLVMK